jgi:hypothetical protein
VNDRVFHRCDFGTLAEWNFTGLLEQPKIGTFLSPRLVLQWGFWLLSSSQFVRTSRKVFVCFIFSFSRVINKRGRAKLHYLRIINSSSDLLRYASQKRYSITYQSSSDQTNPNPPSYGVNRPNRKKTKTQPTNNVNTNANRPNRNSLATCHSI